MAKHPHRDHQENVSPELGVPHADLTVRIVLWIAMGMAAVALALWWFWT